MQTLCAIKEHKDCYGQWIRYVNSLALSG